MNTVTRFEKTLLGKSGRKYIPDFLLDEHTIVEIKGYEKEESVAAKTAIAEEYGFKVIVLRKHDLAKEFEWVSRVHKKKSNLESMYDGYLPKYTYECSQCEKSFSRNKKAKTSLVYCSQRCAGKFRAEKKHYAPIVYG